MDRSYEVLKQQFSSSNKHSSSCNPAYLVIFAEHAAKSGHTDIAANCLQIYFDLSPPTNQFYIRAHLCEALIYAPTNIADQARLLQALNLVVKAVNLAKASECYHFLVYNASLLTWLICRLYNYPGVRHLFAKPLQTVVKALDECKEQDYEWRLRLLMLLIHSQIEAGCKEDAAQTCASAIQLARKKIPSKLLDVLKVQIYYNLGEVKKYTESASELAAIYQLYKTKGIIHQQSLNAPELEQKLHRVFSLIAGTVDHPVSRSAPKTAQMTLLLELGALCIEYYLPSLAQEVVLTVSAANISNDTRLILMQESLVCQVGLQRCNLAKRYSHRDVEVRIKAVEKMTNLLKLAKRTQHFDLIQYLCVALWNVSFPLLHQNLRKQILKPLCDCASALEDICSILFQLRANLHFEIAKIFLEQQDLKTCLKHLEESSALDISGEHSEQLKILKKHVILTIKHYEIPDNCLDQAIRLINQASGFSSLENLRPLLINAGELLVPNFFTSSLRNISMQRNESDQLRAYTQCKLHIQDCMATVGDENDRKRCKILADMVKIARRHCVWDVASVAARMCLCYDEKVLQVKESGDNTLSEHISFETSSVSKQASSSFHLQSSTAVENNLISLSGCREDVARDGKEMIALLAEIHCILAECLVNDLQLEEFQLHQSPPYLTHKAGQSYKDQKLCKEWASVVTEDIMKAFIRAAKMSSSVGEGWLAYNAAASLWNYTHQGLEVDQISVSRQLLPMLKQVDLRSDSVLGICVCVALSDGLVKKWTPTKSVSGKGTSTISTSAKKSGRQTTKKGRDPAGGEQLQLHVDPEGVPELKEALEVCEYGMNTYSAVPLDFYKKLLVVWVRCKQLLQHPIPAKTLVIGEGMESIKYRAIVAVEMLSLLGNGVWDFPNCPAPDDVVKLLMDCQLNHNLIEMTLWTKLGKIALKQKDYTTVRLCADTVNKISHKAHMGSQKHKCTTEAVLLSLASNLKGHCLSTTSNGNVDTIKNTLEAYLNSARFGHRADSYMLVMESCYHYWNTCLPLAAISVERDILLEPMLELLSLTASFVNKRSESIITIEPTQSLSSHEQDHNVLIAMYGLVFQAYTDKYNWKKGLQVVEDAIRVMPKTISRHLFMHKLVFKSRMNKNIEGDMLKFQDEPDYLVASMWYQAAKNSTDRAGGLRAYRNAIQLLQSCDQSWQKVEYLIEFSEWLHRQQFPPQDTIDHLQKAVDLILSIDSGKVESLKTSDQHPSSDTSNMLNIHQLECLLRVHVMMSQLHAKGSNTHKQLIIMSFGFCLQMWKLTYRTLSQDLKSNIPNLPSTVVEWASFQIPEQLMHNMKTGSNDTFINKCSLNNPMLTMYYLGVLVESLSETGIDALAIPVLHLQLAIAGSLIAHSKPLCQLLHMRLASLCRELGVISDLYDKFSGVVPDPENIARSLVEIEQLRESKRTIKQSKLPGNSLQAKHTEINVVKDAVVLRKIWLQQALILISQGEYSYAHELLNHSLESCQIFEDNNTLFRVLSVLSILALNEKDREKFIDFFLEAQKLTCEVDHWLDGILVLTNDFAIVDDDYQFSSTLEYAVSFMSSLGERLKNSATVKYGISVLTSRLNLFKQKIAPICCNGGLFQTSLLHSCELVTEAADSLLNLGCRRKAAHVLGEQAQLYGVMASHIRPQNLELCHEYFLKALKLYERSINILYNIYYSARILCQSPEDVSLPIQRDLIHTILRFTEILLVAYEEYSDVMMLTQSKFQKKSSIEKVIDEFVCEVPMLSLIEEDWKLTTKFAIEKALGFLSSAHFLAQWNSLLKAKCTYSVGCGFYLLARHSSREWGLQWRRQEIIYNENKGTKVKMEASADNIKNDLFGETKTSTSANFQPSEYSANEGTRMITKSRQVEDKTKVSESVSLHLLSQSCHSLTEALCSVSSNCDWTTGACTIPRIIDCCGNFDPVASSQYLAFYQSLSTSMKFEKLLKKIHYDPNGTQLSALLKQNDKLCWQKCCSALQANTDQLKTYEVYRRLQISENHLELLRSFPANFRFIVLQHSLDRSQLFTAYLTPPHPSPPAPKKGQQLQQIDSVDSLVSRTEVLPKEFRFLQETLQDCQIPLLAKTGSAERADSQLAVVVMAMEQYFAEALKTVANELSKENNGKELLSVVILGDSDILQLPLEAMAIFEQDSIASVVRDFSLQILYHRIQVFNSVDEEAKEKKKVDKHQPQPVTVLADVAKFKYVLGSRKLCCDSVNSLINFLSSNKVTSKWSGFYSLESTLSLLDWCAVLKSASGFLLFGSERIFAYYPPSQLTTMNLQKCHMILLIQCKNVSLKEEYSTSSRKPESCFEETVPSMILLSLAGAGCIVVNQGTCSVVSSHLVRDLDLLLEGNSTGSVNWTHVKTNLKSVDNLMGDHDNDAVSPIVTKGKEHQSYKKHPSSAVLDTVVYGLPHITLTNDPDNHFIDHLRNHITINNLDNHMSDHNTISVKFVKACEKFSSVLSCAVVYTYEPHKPSYPFLHLKFGDVVQILEENGGWYRGFSVRNKHNKGIFPASHVNVKDCNLKNPGPDEVITPKDDPIVQEISDVLREWSLVWKRLYAEGKRRQFQEITQLMRDLLDRRRQILSKTLPRDELKELKLSVGSKIDYGNRMLFMDYVPRDESGTPIDSKTAGVMHLYKVMKQSIQTNEPGNRKSYVHLTTQPAPLPKRDEHHLFLKFSALALPVNEPCELFFFIYDAKQSKVLSERYMIALSQHCLPKDPEKINQCFAVFSDLDSSDLNNKELYLACQVVRVGNHLEGKTTAVPLRKPHGAAVFPLHEILAVGLSGDQEEKDIQMDVFVCPPPEFYRLLDSVIKKQGIYHATDKGTGVFISLKLLKGPLGRVKEENPLLFRKFTAECQKLGFPEIIRPYDVRHDVYLTLDHGVFNKGTKRADKNVEIDMEIVDEKEQIIPGCIQPGIGEPCVDNYRSLVQYHCATPFFFETVKIVVPPEKMRIARVRFSMYHKSTIISSRLSRSEPFAISHVKLMKDDDTTIEDGVHELFVYKFKETSRGAYKYTTLPCIVEPSVPHIVSPELLSPRDSFFIRTQICSTKLTQNVDLHRLLHWRQNIERLPSILTAVVKVPGDEIVKFLGDTFNALFAIMEEMAEEVGDLVFEALVFIIGLLAVEKYENFRPVLDTYCDKLFHAASVHTHLVARMKYVFEQVMLVDGTRKMRGDIIQKTLKAAEFLIKFIIKSRALYEEGTQGKGSEAFNHSLHDLLSTVCEMMKLEGKENELIAPRAQAQALQFLPQTFDLFLSVLNVKSLGKIVAELLMNLRENKLKVYKSAFVTAVVSSELFKQKESRVKILPAILRHLRYHIKNRDDLHLLEKSFDVLGSILMNLHDQEQATVDEEVSTVVQEMLLVLLDCFTSLTEKSEKAPHSVGHCVAVLMALLELMTPKHYQMLRLSLINSSTDETDLGEFIQCTFNAFCELVALNLYPSDWTALKLLQNYVILRTTNQLSRILVEDFLGPENDPLLFNPALWQNFFQLAVAFTCQLPLQLEVISEVKRNRIMDCYGDMRIAMNSLMINKWMALGNYQSRYVPGMIGPFLKVSLLPHTSIRRNTIPIFFDMMETEFKYKKNFHMMETEMIDKLDVFISGGMGDAKYRAMLYQMLSERCKSNPVMEREGGMVFIESLAELLRRLMDYRAVPQGDRDQHMHVMFNLLNFYKEMGREEIYIRYIYHLAELHNASGNWVEAGFTLLLHAQLLQWSLSMQKAESSYPRQSSAERKEALYHDIIEYFDKGKLWECGIEQCKEMAYQLESVTFNYEKLSEIHKTIARFYSNIVSEIRAEPEYFRVGFYGGFPPFLKSKVFIYRGLEYEKLSDFNARLSTQFPNAKFMKTLEAPGLDIIESDEQFIQSCSVDPIPEKDVMSKFDNRNVAESIVRFYHTNHVRRFKLKRPFHQGTKDKENEYKTLYTECKLHTTAYRFPGILRWFEVTETEVIVKNPVENGIEMVLDNVQQLRTVINRIRVDSTQSTNPLTMKLNGTLDAAVNGGVSKFEVFFTQEYLDQHPHCKPLIPKLKLYMEELCKVCEEGVALHSQVRPDSMKGLHQRMEELLEDYSARYGGSKDYDPVAFPGPPLLPDIKKERRLSSSRRRDKLKTNERSMTVSNSGRPPSYHEKLESISGSPVLQRRERSATTAMDLNDNLDPTYTQRRSQHSPVISPGHRLPTEGPPPPVPTHRADVPPAPPLRRNVSSSNQIISAGTGNVSEVPPPAPPRSFSVRQSSNRKSGSSFGSRDASPTSTPQTYSPVTPHKELPHVPAVLPQDSEESPPPPVPKKQRSSSQVQHSQLPGTQSQRAPSLDESSEL